MNRESHSSWIMNFLFMNRPCHKVPPLCDVLQRHSFVSSFSSLALLEFPFLWVSFLFLLKLWLSLLRFFRRAYFHSKWENHCASNRQTLWLGENNRKGHLFWSRPWQKSFHRYLWGHPMWLRFGKRLRWLEWPTFYCLSRTARETELYSLSFLTSDWQNE